MTLERHNQSPISLSYPATHATNTAITIIGRLSTFLRAYAIPIYAAIQNMYHGAPFSDKIESFGVSPFMNSAKKVTSFNKNPAVM